MSTVKIQVIQGKDYSQMNKVMVDNRFVYEFGHSAEIERERLTKLLNALDINAEVTDKEIV